MTKTNKIIYWVSTVWLALGMVSSGVVQLMSLRQETEMMNHLGYPLYLLSLIGVWKLLGVIAIFLPRLPILKEWAYAGFFFVMSGAVYSHIVSGDDVAEIFGPCLLICLSLTSWYFRPAHKKSTLINDK